MRIVGFLGDHPRSEFTLSEIARALTMSKTSCQGILAALGEFGTVTKDPGTLRYSIGPAVIGLGIAATERFDFLDVARVEMDEFCAQDGLHWNMGVLSGHEAVVVAASPSGTLGMAPGQRIALTPPIGLVFLGWSSPEFVAWWLDKSTDAEDPELRRTYEHAIEVTRRRGFSIGRKSEAQTRFAEALRSLVHSVEQSELVDTARILLEELAFEEYFHDILDSGHQYEVEFLSVPMFGRGGDMIGAITVGGFQGVLTGTEVFELAGRLSERAKRIADTHAGGPVGEEAPGLGALSRPPGDRSA
jgi:DNA-binding IclR family transcriptional regulator